MPWAACSAFALGIDLVGLTVVRRKEGEQLVAHEVVVVQSFWVTWSTLWWGCIASEDNCRLLKSSRQITARKLYDGQIVQASTQMQSPYSRTEMRVEMEL
jgi:hypothetical protein